MTSLEYAKEIGIYHCNLLRRVAKYVCELKKADINSDVYFKETHYTHNNNVKYKMYELTKEGIELLNSDIYSTNIVEYYYQNTSNNVLPMWVIRNLESYGNCSINPRYLKKYGKEKILNGLLSIGFDCDVDVYEKDYTYFTIYGTPSRETVQYCILTIKSK